MILVTTMMESSVQQMEAALHQAQELSLYITYRATFREH